MDAAANNSTTVAAGKQEKRAPSSMFPNHWDTLG